MTFALLVAVRVLILFIVLCLLYCSDFESWYANALARAPVVGGATSPAGPRREDLSTASTFASAQFDATHSLRQSGSAFGGPLDSSRPLDASLVSSVGVTAPATTGSSEADEDIAAFYRARDELMRRSFARK